LREGERRKIQTRISLFNILSTLLLFLFSSFLEKTEEMREKNNRIFPLFIHSLLLFKRGKGNGERRKIGSPFFFSHLFSFRKEENGTEESMNSF